MYPSEHAATALVLARYRMEEDIARAEAYRAARAARAPRSDRKDARNARRAGRSRGTWLFAALRAAMGRT